MTMSRSTTRGQAQAALLENIKAMGSLLDDIEKTRKANGNRIGALERRHGSSFPHLEAIHAQLAKVEHQAELELCRFWRRHPLAPWAKEIPGLGEKLAARLIAEIGDPTQRAIGHWEKHDLPDGAIHREWVIDGYEPRTVGQLLAYCGHGDPARSKIARDATQEELFKRGNPKAKVRAYLIGAQFVRTIGDQERNIERSLYRDVYDGWRVRYAEKLHEASCVRCGPAGRPAQPGSPWSKAHQMAAAIRNTTKVFLGDLWVEATRLAGETS